MEKKKFSRRTIISSIAGATFTCGVCTGTSEASYTNNDSQNVASTSEWKELQVDGYPFSVKYRDGYQADAEQVRDYAIIGHDQTQDVFPHELDQPISFELYPGDEWGRGGFDGTYYESRRTVEIQAPSDYNGDLTDQSLIDTSHKHLVIHEYLHAPQTDLLDFHTHSNWFTEGFVEALTVYHTTDDIQQVYHNRRDARIIRERIRNDEGFLMGVNEDVYRGAMHLLRFMIDKYGGEAVAEIHDQNAENVVEAMKDRLGINPLDLQQAWLKHAQTKYGGNYVDEIQRLGGSTQGHVLIQRETTFDGDSIIIEEATYQNDDFVIVITDESDTVIGHSETFSAGENVTDRTISLEQSISNPQIITAHLHLAGTEGYGDPITIDGNQITDSTLYTTSAPIVAFANNPSPDDTSVQAHVYVPEDNKTDNELALHVIDGDDTSDHSVHAHKGRYAPPKLYPSDELVNENIELDTDKQGVPLTDGQTVTVAVKDREIEEYITSTTTDVSDTSTTSIKNQIGTTTASYGTTHKSGSTTEASVFNQDSESINNKKGCLITSSCTACVESAKDIEINAADTTRSSDWNKLQVDGYPFSVKYRDGYQADAEQVRDYAIIGHDQTQDVFPHELDQPISFELYPRSEWPRGPFDGSYSEDQRIAQMQAPSDYNGNIPQSQVDTSHKHLVIHEYLHAPQTDLLDFHTHSNWFTEGFVEALTVYYTTDDIQKLYHNRRDARIIQQRIRNDEGFLMGVNEDVYRGAMHLLRFMIDKYGGEAVAEIHDQNAENVVEAMKDRLGINPLDLQQAWLKHAQTKYGGNYVDEIQRLGGSVPEFIKITRETTFDDGQISIEEAKSERNDFVIVIYDDQGSVIGQSQDLSAGEHIQNKTISLNQAIDEPQKVTAKLHHTSSDDYGAAISRDGKNIQDSKLYCTSAPVLDFAAKPVEGDTSIQVNAYVAEESGTDNTLTVVVTANNSKRIHQLNGFDSPFRFYPGEQIVGNEVKLDKNEKSVPLEDGDTVEIVLRDDSIDEQMDVTRTSIEVGQSTEQKSVEEAIAGSDGTIGTSDIQQAIQYWAKNDTVPSTGGKTIEISKLQTLIQMWASGGAL